MSALLLPILLQYYLWCFSIFYIHLFYIEVHALLCYPIFQIIGTMIDFPLSCNIYSGPIFVGWFWWCPWLYLFCTYQCIFPLPFIIFNCSMFCFIPQPHLATIVSYPYLDILFDQFILYLSLTFFYWIHSTFKNLLNIVSAFLFDYILFVIRSFALLFILWYRIIVLYGKYFLADHISFSIVTPAVDGYF